MITFLKRINRIILYAVTGVAVTFAFLADFLSIVATYSYTTGTPYLTLVVLVMIISVALLGLLSKLAIFISYRICNAIFLKKSGLLYPFPILFYDYEAVVYSFLIPGMILCGLIYLPVLFLPALTRVLSAVRTLLFWGTMVLVVWYFVKKFSHDYDKKSLAYSLVLIPLILLGLSLVLTLVEVIR